MSKLTHWKILQSPDYIGAYAIEPGTEPVVTIKSAGVEQVTGTNGKKEECMVVRFAESWAKPLICNVTNSKTIEKVAGTPYIEQWQGVKIQLFVARVNAFGEEVDAIRIRPKAPVTKKPDFTPDSPKWSSAVEKIANGETTVDVIRQHFTVSKETESRLLAEVEQLTQTGEVNA